MAYLRVCIRKYPHEFSIFLINMSDVLFYLLFKLVNWEHTALESPILLKTQQLTKIKQTDLIWKNILFVTMFITIFFFSSFWCITVVLKFLLLFKNLPYQIRIRRAFIYGGWYLTCFSMFTVIQIRMSISVILIYPYRFNGSDVECQGFIPHGNSYNNVIFIQALENEVARI